MRDAVWKLKRECRCVYDLCYPWPKRGKEDKKERKRKKVISQLSSLSFSYLSRSAGVKGVNGSELMPKMNRTLK